MYDSQSSYTIIMIDKAVSDDTNIPMACKIYV